MDMSAYQKKIDGHLAYLNQEFGSLQLWRATPGLLDNVTVMASYGMMKLNQLWHVSVLDSQTLKVEAWDKSEMKNIEKAIYDANLWLSPQNEWSYLIVRIPALTQERRQEMVKYVKNLGEETKAHIRSTRQDAMKENKKLLENKAISENEHSNNELDIDAMTKKATTSIEELVDSKSADVMKV